jgi:glycosyltransferase involved in cell wall biosynthesis
MKRALFVQSTLYAHGGANAVAVWMMEALKNEYEITLLTWRPPDFDALNAHYGTNLRASDLRVLCPVHLPARLLIQAIPDVGTVQMFSYLLRKVKRLGRDYDVILTAEMEADFGRQGIQYVHFPYIRSEYSRRTHSLDMPLADRLRALAHGRARTWMLLSNYSFDRMRENLALVNSNWTARQYHDAFGRTATTLYPPAPGDFPVVPFEERENGFVCVGRFHPGKRQDWIIKTLAKVRTVFPDLRLHLVGAADQSPHEREFRPRLIALQREHSSWVTLHENISRRELTEVLSRQKYGIHAQVGEHFGIGTAEMLRAGCIPFVHNSGGQVEIVGSDPALLYSSADDAVALILRVMRSPELQTKLRDELRRRSALFTPDAFAAGFRQLVSRFIASHAEAGEAHPASLSLV